MIGGFLGAGKTTAMLKIAGQLKEDGQRVGLITNDQSTGLVDTRMLGAAGFPTEEITGGCFCCRFGSLVDAADKLAADVRPDIFLAEPVGSCTDLKATVNYPLRRMYGDNYTVAPLSVLVDPIRAMRILGLATGKSFSPKVKYIYRKQLEEAEIIVINKLDLIDDQQAEALRQALKQEFPRAEVLPICARDGRGIDPWLQRIAGDVDTSPSMEIDYDVYAEGEACLGWVNASARVTGEEAFDGNALVEQIAVQLQTELGAGEAEIAHLKMTFTSDDGGSDLAVANLVRDEVAPELAFRLQAPLERGELIVNLRAEGDPQRLRESVVGVLQGACASIRLTVSIEHIEAFRPARPTPTHRLAEA